MTEIEAHKFIARWRRIIIPWVAITEAQAAYGLLIFSVGFGMGIFFFMLAIISQRNHWHFSDSLEVFVMGFSICLFICFASKTRKACRVLGYSFFRDYKS